MVFTLLEGKNVNLRIMEKEDLPIIADDGKFVFSISLARATKKEGN